MTLSPGTRLGPYEIVAPIGAGGMGEVYKAKDTRLDRSVAIKVLPADLSADPDRRARFAREAKTIAGLNHPHICTLHDVGEHEGTTFLVMEHLTGETLAQRLEKGPLPLEQALTIATEIADALTAAHRQGVVHRDLKPANVMLNKAGAKLLDFGLARLKAHGEQPAAASLASAPTRTAPLTSEGTIIGTLQYMAPEQVEGKPADARTDLWALGAILYEMVTGKRAFEGTSAASVIGKIMNAEPPALAILRPLTPPALERVVQKCLSKDPDTRWQSAADFADDLRWLRTGGAMGGPMPPDERRQSRAPGPASLAIVGLAAALIGAGFGSWLWSLSHAVAVPLPIRTALEVLPAEELNSGGAPLSGGAALGVTNALGGSRTAFAWTPDGCRLVFVGRRGGTQQLYVRALEHDEATPLAGTEGAQLPAVSPDGQWIAFWAEGALKKIRLAGGPAVPIASGLAVVPYGLVWGDGQTLYFGRDRNTGGTIWKVSGSGELTQVTTRNGNEAWHALPCLLPGAAVLLYTAGEREFTWGGEQVVAQTLATGARTILLRDAVDARYVPPGYLVFLRRGVMWAVRFDARTLKTQGAEVALLDSVGQSLTPENLGDLTGAGQFALSSMGTLAWVRGPIVPLPLSTVVAVNRQGRVSPLTIPDRCYGSRLRLAPGGRELVVTVRDVNEVALWTHDLVRHNTTPVLRGGEATSPIWTPDGQRLVFKWLNEGRRSLAWRPAGGEAHPEVLVDGNFYPSSWTPDGQHLGVVRLDDGSLAIVTVEQGHVTVKSLPHDAGTRQAWPEFSPDGHWLAYGSDDSGRWEIYVQPYPDGGTRAPISVDGGREPAWRADGRGLFFVSVGSSTEKPHMMEVDLQLGPRPVVGTPRQLFEIADGLTFTSTNIRPYDVTPDGQLFFVRQERVTPPLPMVTHINLILNWFEELKAKVPTGR